MSCAAATAGCPSRAAAASRGCAGGRASAARRAGGRDGRGAARLHRRRGGRLRSSAATPARRLRSTQAEYWVAVAVAAKASIWSVVRRVEPPTHDALLLYVALQAEGGRRGDVDAVVCQPGLPRAERDSAAGGGQHAAAVAVAGRGRARGWWGYHPSFSAGRGRAAAMIRTCRWSSAGYVKERTFPRRIDSRMPRRGSMTSAPIRPGGKRHLRYRARTATGQVAGAVTEKPGLQLATVQDGLPSTWAFSQPKVGASKFLLRHCS